MHLFYTKARWDGLINDVSGRRTDLEYSQLPFFLKLSAPFFYFVRGKTLVISSALAAHALVFQARGKTYVMREIPPLRWGCSTGR